MEAEIVAAVAGVLPAAECTGAAVVVSEQRPKRTHDESNVHDIADDDNMMTSSNDNEDDDSDGDFMVFLSRYQKRLRRQQEAEADASVHQLIDQHSSQQSVPSNRGQRQRQRQRKPSDQLRQSTIDKHSGKSKSRSERYDEAINTVISQADNQTNQTIHSYNNDDIDKLNVLVQDLQGQVATLTSQIEFLMSIVGTTSGTVGLDHSDQIRHAPKSYSSVVSQSIKCPAIDKYIAAVHTDLKLKQSRQNNLVVTGLPENDDVTDEELFSKLCSVEFGISPVVSQTKRLGKKFEGRLQPVLVVFQEAEQAKLLLSLARTLRDSSNSYTARSVYLSPHLTRAERQAEYEERCRRRQRSEARSSRPPQDVSRPQPIEADSGHMNDRPAIISQPPKPRAEGQIRKTSTSGRGHTMTSASSTSAVLPPAAIPADASSGIGSASGNIVHHTSAAKLTMPTNASPSTATQSSLNVNVAPFQSMLPCTPSQPPMVQAATDLLTFTVPQLEFYLEQAKQSTAKSLTVSFSAPVAAAATQSSSR